MIVGVWPPNDMVSGYREDFGGWRGTQVAWCNRITDERTPKPWLWCFMELCLHQLTAFATFFGQSRFSNALKESLPCLIYKASASKPDLNFLLCLSFPLTNVTWLFVFYLFKIARISNHDLLIRLLLFHMSGISALHYAPTHACVQALSH